MRALIRSTTDGTFLQSLGCELLIGDLNDPNSCKQAARGADVVYHCAAKVGDWGSRTEFKRSGVDATTTLAEAALAVGVGRFVHFSSTSAYGHPKPRPEPIGETEELGQNLWFWDEYTRSKVESEHVLWRLSGEKRLPLTVVRPSWLYGERDRTTIPRLVKRLRAGIVPLIGPGNNPMSAVYAGCVADAAIMAADDPGSAGEAYNVTDQGNITQREFLNLVAKAAGAREISHSRPYPLIYSAAFVLEAFGRLTRQERPPLITRYATWLMGRSLAYSTKKARTRLGWTPAFTYEESIERAVRWHFEHDSGAASAGERSAALSFGS